MSNTVIAWFSLVVMIIVHELGHLIAAKRAGVRVKEFGIGFRFLGLTIPLFTWGETKFVFNLLLLGGYVEMEDDPDDERSLLNASSRDKMWISFAGPLANMIFASFTISLAIYLATQNIPRALIMGPLVGFLGSLALIPLSFASLIGVFGWESMGGAISAANLMSENLSQPSQFGGWTETLLFLLAIFNIGLASFNLMPIPPLDGSHIMEELLKPYPRLYAIGKFVMVIGILLLVHAVLRSCIADAQILLRR